MTAIPSRSVTRRTMGDCFIRPKLKEGLGTNRLTPMIAAVAPWRKIPYAQERGWSVPWTIRRVERRVSPQRRRGIDNRSTERDGAMNRRRADRRVGTSAAPASRIRVLVVEDNRLMRDGLARLLAGYPDVEIVASADTADAGTQLLRSAKPQVVLLDAALAEGLGNKEIAQRLNIATNTVKSHVHNMLGKLAALTPPDRRKGNRSRRGTSRRSYRFTR